MSNNTYISCCFKGIEYPVLVIRDNRGIIIQQNNYQNANHYTDIKFRNAVVILC